MQICPTHTCTQNSRNVPHVISVRDLMWTESLREGLVQLRPSFLAIGIKCFGVRGKKLTITCVEGRLVLVSIQ